MPSNKKNRRRRRLLIRLAAIQDNLCFHCQRPMQLPDPEAHYENGTRNGDEIASYDHLLPRSLGGLGGFNLVIAHRSCNSRRGHAVPSELELSRLAELNIRRQHLFTANHGRISPASFGEVTASSIALAEVLNELSGEAAAKQRHQTCRFVTAIYQDVRALDAISGFADWMRLVTLVRDHHLQRLYAPDCSILAKDRVSRVIHELVRSRIGCRQHVAMTA